MYKAYEEDGWYRESGFIKSVLRLIACGACGRIKTCRVYSVRFAC